MGMHAQYMLLIPVNNTQPLLLKSYSNVRVVVTGSDSNLVEACGTQSLGETRSRLIVEGATTWVRNQSKHRTFDGFGEHLMILGEHFPTYNTSEFGRTLTATEQSHSYWTLHHIIGLCTYLVWNRSSIRRPSKRWIEYLSLLQMSQVRVCVLPISLCFRNGYECRP